MSKKIKTAIVGLGRSGWDIHCNSMEKLTDLYHIALVCDPDPDKAKEGSERFSCRGTSDFDEVLADPEVELLTLATPSSLHEGQSLAGLKAGKHVLCEKPMALTIEGAWQIQEQAEKSGKCYSVFQNRRFFSDYLYIQSVLESGVLGDVFQIKLNIHQFTRRWDWQTMKKCGGGILNNVGPHIVDLALKTIGFKEPEHIACYSNRVLSVGDAEDHVKILLKGTDMPLVEIELNSACAYPQDNWLITGSKGSLCGNYNEIKWKAIDDSLLVSREAEDASTAQRIYNSEELKFNESNWTTAEEPATSYLRYYQHLFQSIVNGAPLQVSIDQLLLQTKIMDECRAQINA